MIWGLLHRRERLAAGGTLGDRGRGVAGGGSVRGDDADHRRALRGELAHLCVTGTKTYFERQLQ